MASKPLCRLRYSTLELSTDMSRISITMLLVVATAIAVAACDPSGPDPDPGPPAYLLKVSGDSQVAAVNQPLSEPLVVRVLDEDSVPVPGTEIRWSIEYRGSTELGPRGAHADPPISTTDQQGYASTDVTLGEEAGLYLTLAWGVSVYPGDHVFASSAASFDRDAADHLLTPDGGGNSK